MTEKEKIMALLIKAVPGDIVIDIPEYITNGYCIANDYVSVVTKPKEHGEKITYANLSDEQLEKVEKIRNDIAYSILFSLPWNQ